MRSLIASFALLLALPCAGSAHAATTHAIVRDVARTTQVSKRVVTIWWLPVEYWEAAARELGWKPDAIATLREKLATYTVIGMVDAALGADKRFSFAEQPAIAERLTVQTGGAPISVVRKLDPEVTRPLPELSYPLRASLAGLGNGFRLLLFPNAGADGKPVIDGTRPGVVQLRYAIEGDPIEHYWHAPLTSVAGERRDPKTGEPVEASWRFNPWSGDKLP